MLGETLRVLVDEITRAFLFHAAYFAAREMLEILLNSSLFTEVMNPRECIDALGETLDTAISRGYDDWVDVLLAYGADPNRKGKYNKTPLDALSYQGTTSTLDVLLSHGAWLEGEHLLPERAFVRTTPLLVGDMLRRHADANVVVKNHGSLLHEAASYGDGSTVLDLIVVGFADVDARDKQGRTPLMVTASGETVSRRAGDTPQEQILDMLISAGADIHAVDLKQRSVLAHAVLGWSAECMLVLLEGGADPNAQDAKGRTPMIAMLTRSRNNVYDHVEEVLSLLLVAGADPLIPNHEGVSTAQMLASTESGRAFIEARQPFFRPRS